jgi:hypothetical protein
MLSVPRCCAFCAVFLVSLSGPARSQDVTGELEGWVVDTNGTPLAEASAGWGSG